jgi:hypothetical protein
MNERLVAVVRKPVPASKPLEDSDYEERPLKWDWRDDDEVEMERADTIWIRDTRRNFIEFDDYDDHLVSVEHWNKGIVHLPVYAAEDTPLSALKKDGIDCEDWLVVLPFKAAWGVEPDNYKEMSKEYEISIKIYVVEQGIGFYQGFSFKNGKSVEATSFRGGTYMDFVWECPFPGLGG